MYSFMIYENYEKFDGNLIQSFFFQHLFMKPIKLIKYYYY